MTDSLTLPVLPLRKSNVWTVSGASSGTLRTFFAVRLALATMGLLFSLRPELKTVGPNNDAGGEVVAPVVCAGMVKEEEGFGEENYR